MPTQINFEQETTIRWQDSGADETMTLASLGAAAGRNGALHDWGVQPRSSRFHWKFRCQFDTAPVVGESLQLYLREAGMGTSATDPTNDDGTGDTAMATDKERNLRFIGTLVVDEAATGIVMSAEGEFESYARFSAPSVRNNTVDALHATVASNYFEITPVPDEIQD